jgi:RNA polymerase sigma-70 factor (ECF subfamily)
MSNLLIDHHRSRATERLAVDRLANRTHTEPPTTDSDGDEWSSLLSGLPPRQRLILTLYYGEDLAVTDIAENLGISVNSVKSALSKGRDTLRARWEHTYD